MRKLTATLIAACALAAFHVLFVVVPTAFPSHSNNSCGAGQAVIVVVLLDFPLVALAEALPRSLHDTLIRSDQFFWFGGTLMYAGVGAFIGWVIDTIRHNIRPA